MSEFDHLSKDLDFESSVEETSPVTRVVKVKVPSEPVKLMLNSKYEELKKSVSLKGFRKGKAPMGIVKKFYQDTVESEVKSQLLGQVFKKLIETHDLKMISDPEMQKADIDKDGAFDAEILFEVTPEVEPKDYKGLEITREQLDVLEKAVDGRLENIREQHSSLEPIDEDRAAENGDTAELDFVGKIDGEAFEGGEGKNMHLELGSSRFIPGFEEGVVGMKPGETKELDLKFPLEYPHAKVAGKDVVFTVTLNALKKKILPELDDEFAKDLGGDFKTIDEVKDKIREQITRNEEARIRRNDRSNLIDKLLEVNDVTAPPSLIASRVEQMKETMKYQYRMSGLEDGQINEFMAGMDDRFKEEAEKEVKAAFLFNAIGDKEKLEVSDEDIENKLKDMAEQSGRNIEAIKAMYEKDDSIGGLKEELLQDKVLDFLLENANVTWEEKVSEQVAEASEKDEEKPEESAESKEDEKE